MTELTQAQKNKLLAAAEIVESGDLAVLKKLLDFQDKMDEWQSFIDSLPTEIKKGIPESISELRERLVELSSLIDELGGMGKENMGAILEVESQLSNKITETQGLIKKAGDAFDGLKREIKRVEGLIPELPPETDLTDIYNRVLDVEKKIPKIPDELKPEQVRDKMESLEGEERLDKKAIKGLEDMERELNERISSIPRGGPGRRIFVPYRDDLSASCDGSTKTFYLSKAPLNDAVTMVYGTDFPVILRPTIDFTIANKILTLTSAVSAPSSGATLICTFFA